MTFPSTQDAGQESSHTARPPQPSTASAAPLSTQSTTGSYPATANDVNPGYYYASDQEALGQEHVDAYVTEPWEQGNRLGSLPYQMGSVDGYYHKIYAGPVYPNTDGQATRYESQVYGNGGPAVYIHGQQVGLHQHNQALLGAGSWTEGSHPPSMHGQLVIEYGDEIGQPSTTGGQHSSRRASGATHGHGTPGHHSQRSTVGRAAGPSRSGGRPQNSRS